MDRDETGGATPPVSDQIDANLKRVYREIVGDDVPDRFRQLLDQLRQQDAPAPAAEAEPERRSGERA